jgi:hypothetical protein
MAERTPTSSEFEASCQDEFGFLLDAGFRASADGEFRVRFTGPQFDVLVKGEGYGTQVSVSISSGDSAPIPI